jgi:hypothetical protein
MKIEGRKIGRKVWENYFDDKKIKGRKQEECHHDDITLFR